MIILIVGADTLSKLEKDASQCFYHGSASKIQGNFLQPKEQFNSDQDKRVMGVFVTSDMEQAKFFALWKCLTGCGQTRLDIDEETGKKKIFFERLSANIKTNFYLYTVYESTDVHFVHDKGTEFYSTKPVKISEQQTFNTIDELNKLGYEIYALNKPSKKKPSNHPKNNVDLRLEMQQAIIRGEYHRVDVSDLVKQQKARNIFQKLFSRSNS